MTWCVFGQNGEEELTWTPEYGYAFVYVLLDPRDQTVRYVGKCQNPRSRLSDHMSARSKGGGSRYEWTQELKRLGLQTKMRILEKVTLVQSRIAERKWIEFYEKRGSLLNEIMPRKGPPLPVPFDQLKMRRNICNAADVCESTLLAWVAGSQKVDVHRCRSLAAACLSMGIVPPANARIPPPIGVEIAPSKALRVVS